MKRACNALTLLLVLLMLSACAPAPQNEADTGAWSLTFTDSTAHTVALAARPQRVAVLFSSLADIWTLAGGEVAITVGESVERGICDETAVLVDSGAGKTVNAEALIAAAPDLVIVSADIPAQVELAALLREMGIPVAEFCVDSFTDYLAMLKICTDITGRPELYATHGTAQKARIDEAIAAQPLAGERILFVRAGSSARSVKPKGSADHFAAAMLVELGAVNIADGTSLPADGLSMEAILREDPDRIYFVSMGDEAASRAFVESMLTGADWASLSAVKNGAWCFLPKETFHYKPARHFADAYEYLAHAAASK